MSEVHRHIKETLYRFVMLRNLTRTPYLDLEADLSARYIPNRICFYLSIHLYGTYDEPTCTYLDNHTFLFIYYLFRQTYIF